VLPAIEVLLSDEAVARVKREFTQNTRSVEHGSNEASK